MCKSYTRREFLKIATVAVGIAVSSDFSEASQSDLVLAVGEPPSKLVEASIEAIGGMRRFISAGDVVVVKPNIGFDRTPEYAANTNPEVVETVVRLALSQGAKTVKVFDRTVNDPRRCYVQSGIKKAVEKAGGEIYYVDERRFVDTDIKGSFLKRWPLYRDILEADKVINVPIAKHHSLARLTMAMKNWMGVIGGKRQLWHQNLSECLVDLATVIKPTLTVLDAIRVLVAGGPSGGSLEDVRTLNTIIVGVDQVAVDALGATLFGLRPKDLRYLTLAQNRGVGRIDIENLRVKKIKL